MKVIKRNGAEVNYDEQKIISAIQKANASVPEFQQMTDEDVRVAAKSITTRLMYDNVTPSVEDIQRMVIREIMRDGKYELAESYITYRYRRSLARKANTTDEEILRLVDDDNEMVKQENSNKNPVINSTKRDYIAGQVSRDITERILLPEDVVSAHREGIIHFHDADYFIQRMYNCCLVNLDDILQNGTAISGTGITKPHSFATACNIATQVVAQVASNQFGLRTAKLKRH